MSLAGRTVAITADRRWDQQADFFTKRGASIVHAPTMKTLYAHDSEALRGATDACIASPPAHVAITTGVGLRTWLEAARAWSLEDALVAALAGSSLAVRGAKAASAARGAGLVPAWQGSAERMSELVDHLCSLPLEGAVVDVQLDGTSLDDAHDRLTAAGALVRTVPVYRWALPDDTAAVEALAGSIARGDVDAVTFTSAPAVDHLFSLAPSATELVAAFDSSVVAGCVGPVCAEALAAHGVSRSVFPPEGRLLPMLRAVEAALGA